MRNDDLTEVSALLSQISTLIIYLQHCATPFFEQSKADIQLCVREIELMNKNINENNTLEYANYETFRTNSDLVFITFQLTKLIPILKDRLKSYEQSQGKFEDLEISTVRKQFLDLLWLKN